MVYVDKQQLDSANTSTARFQVKRQDAVCRNLTPRTENQTALSPPTDLLIAQPWVGSRARYGANARETVTQREQGPEFRRPSLTTLTTPAAVAVRVILHPAHDRSEYPRTVPLG